jgi:hypothetical protein
LVDLDKCRSAETGEIEPWAADIIEQFPGTYMEISASKTGIHILGLTTRPLPAGRKRGRTEIYTAKRYMVMTGDVLPGHERLGDVTEAALKFHAEMFPPASPRPPQTSTGASPIGVTIEDDALIERAMSAANGSKFAQLWSGNTSGYSSPSEADLALASMVAFWTSDPDQLDRVFRLSGLYRPKWERSDYRSRTIARALERSETYTAPTRITATSATAAPSDAPTDGLAETDACRLELADLRRELAAVQQERDDARNALAMTIQVMLNPNISATEKVAIVATNGIAQHKRDTGQLESDGSVIVSAAEISDDWRKAPPPGERIAPLNQTGHRPRMSRDRVKSTFETMTERGLIAAEPRTVVRTGPGGTPYKETTWALDPVSTAEFLATAASWRPAEPVARKPRRIAIPCSSCGEVHPIIRTDICEGCGSVRDRRKIEPVGDLEAATPPTLPASDNLSDITLRGPRAAWRSPMSDKLSEGPETPTEWFPPAHPARYEWQTGAPSAPPLQDELQPARGDPWPDDDDAFADMYGVI